MLAYLLKSFACMALFLVFYQFLLEKERMHHFKRFYLLGSIVASLIIPALVFTTYTEPPVLPETLATDTLVTSEAPLGNQPASDMEVVNWSLLLWSVYGIGVIIVGFRFISHLLQIFYRIKRNPKRKEATTTRVLLTALLPPHTFFHYVFLNKKELENQSIPQEVLLHEETHANQLHSLDVLLIELLHVFLWFNPLVILYKRNIKLNHEFLADSAVLKNDISTKSYQNTLLSYLSNESKVKYQSVKMANAINYSSIKKRFIIMKRSTSPKIMILKSLLLLPLVALMTYGFSTKNEVYYPAETDELKNTEHTARSMEIHVLPNNQYVVDGKQIAKKALKQFVYKLHQDITPEIRNNILNIHVSAEETLSNEETWFLFNTLKEYGFYRMVTPTQEIVKGKGNTPFAPDKADNQDKGATRDEMKEYNSLAKKYNEMPKNEMRIKMKEVERMTFIYNKMSEKQRADAEPFPYIPEPPKAPKPPRSEMATQGVQPPKPPKQPKIASDQEYASVKVDSILKNQDPNDGPTISVNASALPPAPPTPPSPLDHVIDMAKKGAVFFYEGQEISSDKAIALLKADKDLNIESKRNNSKRPVVNISKAPIRVKRK